MVGKPKIHFITWSLFITWEVVFVGLFFGDFGHPITYITHYAIIITLFYIHSLYVLPLALRNSKQAIWKVPLFAILEISGFILLSFLIDTNLKNFGFLNSTTTLTLNFQYIIKSLYRVFYFLGFATGYYFLATYFQEKKKTEDLEKRHLKDIIERQKIEDEKIKAQNAFLLAQINPHFFFNTLDYLYHNVLDISPKSAEAISILATVMRFAIDADKVGDRIRLGDEIEQVENLVYLNQLRERQAIILEVENGVRDLEFIPLILLTLAENIFKHGYLKNPDHPASIKILTTNEEFKIVTTNLVSQRIIKNSSKQGLVNIKKRLENAYGDSITFVYGRDDNDLFKVSLAIPFAVLNPFVSSSSSLSIDIDKL